MAKEKVYKDYVEGALIEIGDKLSVKSLEKAGIVLGKIVGADKKSKERILIKYGIESARVKLYGRGKNMWAEVIEILADKMEIEEKDKELYPDDENDDVKMEETPIKPKEERWATEEPGNPDDDLEL